MTGVSPSAQRALKGRGGGAFLMHLNGGYFSCCCAIFSCAPDSVRRIESTQKVFSPEAEETLKDRM